MEKFEPNALVKKLLLSKNIKGLRSALITIINSDRRYETDDFYKSLNCIVNEYGIKEIYEKFDPSMPIVSKEVKGRNFTKNDLSDAMYYLEVNFSKERIEDVEIVSKNVYSQLMKENEKRKEIKQSILNEDVKKKYSSHKTEEKKTDSEKIVKGVVAVVAVAAIAAIVIKILK